MAHLVRYLLSITIFGFSFWTLLTGCGGGIGDGEGGDDPEPSAVTVRAAAAELTTLHPRLELVGVLAAIPEGTAIISPRTSGTVEEVSVVEGAQVKAGDLVARLDDRPAKAEAAKAAASVKDKEALLARLKHGYLPQEVEVAKQEAKMAELNLKTLRTKLESTRGLRERREVSAVAFESLKSSVETAEAEFATARAKLDLIEAGYRAEDVAAAEAKLAMAEAELAAARLAVQFCQITSPIAGVVTELQARRGMFVEPSKPLATVVDLSRLFAQIRVPWAYLAKVESGARVAVRVPSVPGRTFEGAVTRLGGEAGIKTGDVNAYATIESTDGRLRPGMACRVVLWLPAVENALAIPIKAVADRNGTPVVTVVRDDKAYEVEVATGVRTRNEVQVIHGLSAGDMVATEGGYGLPAGCPVIVAPSNSRPRDVAEPER